MIKMRENKNENSKCTVCGIKWENTRMMLDIKFNEEIICICKNCSDELFKKLLKSDCIYNERVKTNEDQKRINNENIIKHRNEKEGIKASEALRGIQT